ncbi:unnamed protein product [Amoebophrya sp. A120]|nr:unnamed protein product [Amoebophrya sp. A120]|eukprot:GSA120T00020510001.1
MATTSASSSAQQDQADFLRFREELRETIRSFRPSSLHDYNFAASCSSNQNSPEKLRLTLTKSVESLGSDEVLNLGRSGRDGSGDFVSAGTNGNAGARSTTATMNNIATTRSGGHQSQRLATPGAAKTSLDAGAGKIYNATESTSTSTTSSPVKKVVVTNSSASAAIGIGDDDAGASCRGADQERFAGTTAGGRAAGTSPISADSAVLQGTTGASGGTASSAEQSTGSSSKIKIDKITPINLHLFGPQGSGKTSFLRTCFRAYFGEKNLPKEIENLEKELYRTDDGTSKYSVYKLTDWVHLHDTRGQREYSDVELEQLRLVLDGRAMPGSVIEQRKRYWLMLREFWKSDEEMKKAFSRKILNNSKYSNLNTSPHFVFFAIDPTQQELLYEDTDFRDSYKQLLREMRVKEIPYAVLCTHGDLLDESGRKKLHALPKLLRIDDVPQGLGGDNNSSGQQESGYFHSDSFHASTDTEQCAQKAPPTTNGSKQSTTSTISTKEIRLPDTIRIVTNYTKPTTKIQTDCDTEEDLDDPAANLSDVESLCEVVEVVDNNLNDIYNPDFPLPIPQQIANIQFPPQPPLPPKISLTDLASTNCGSSSSSSRSSLNLLLDTMHKSNTEGPPEHNYIAPSSGGGMKNSMLNTAAAGAAATTGGPIWTATSSSSEDEATGMLNRMRVSSSTTNATPGTGAGRAGKNVTMNRDSSSTALSPPHQPDENVEQDIHILLVLVDALNQADHYLSTKGTSGAGVASGTVVPSPGMQPFSSAYNDEEACAIL